MQRVELSIANFAHGGLGVARHDGRVVFVADAIPGERVIAQLTDQSKDRFWRAVALEVKEASPDRVNHIWPEADVSRPPEQRAGGAELGFVRLERQRALKREVIAEALFRFAGLEGVTPDVQPVDPIVHWRTRLTLHVDERGIAGPRAARSHRVIEIVDHPLADPALQRLAPWRTRAPGVRRIDLVAPSEGEPVMVALTDRSAGRPAGVNPPVETFVTETVGAHRFTVATQGFWQVHRRAAQTLTAAVSRALAEVGSRVSASAEALDLYGGVGLLALPLAEALRAAGERSPRVISVESDPAAHQCAVRNLASMPQVRAVQSRVDDFLAGYHVEPGATVVLDPPRAGAGRQVVEHLARGPAARIVYVACDPVAFARDLGYFRGHGWRLDAIEAFDLFPQTHHVELVARIIPGR